MRIFSIAFMLMISVAAGAQPASYEVSNDPKNGQVVFKGPVTFDDLQKEPTFGWLKSGTGDYKPNQKKIKILRGKLSVYSIVVFMGTWCSDTHEMLPKFYRVLQETGFPMDEVVMYGVEREKTTRSELLQKYGITNLPTIIVIKGGVEAGRITETVKKSVEGDLLKIVNQ